MKTVTTTLVGLGMLCTISSAQSAETNRYSAAMCAHTGLTPQNGASVSNTSSSTKMAFCSLITNPALPTIDYVEVFVTPGVDCTLRNDGGQVIYPNSTTHYPGQDVHAFTTDRASSTRGWAMECHLPPNGILDNYAVILK